MRDDPAAEAGATSHDPRSQLFLVRLWWETADGGSTGEWRGWVEHASSHERRYFRQFGVVSEFISSWLDRSTKPQSGAEPVCDTLTERERR